jgi:hypothetical protein
MQNSPLNPWIRYAQLVRSALLILETAALPITINAFIRRSSNGSKCIMRINNTCCILWASEVGRASSRSFIRRPLTSSIPLSTLPGQLWLLSFWCCNQRWHAETNTASSTSAVRTRVVELSTGFTTAAVGKALSAWWVFAVQSCW